MINSTVAQNVQNLKCSKESSIMLFFGHELVQSENFKVVNSIQDIQATKPNQTLLIKSLRNNIDIVNYCKDNNISYAVICKSVQDALLANALRASYTISNLKIAKAIQQVATEYLFDTKILALLDDYGQIEEVASYNIDGVIFQKAIS